MSGAVPQTYLKVYALLPVTVSAEDVELSADLRTRISQSQIMKITFDLRSDWRVAADIPEGTCPTAYHCFGGACRVERRRENKNQPMTDYEDQV